MDIDLGMTPCFVGLVTTHYDSSEVIFVARDAVLARELLDEWQQEHTMYHFHLASERPDGYTLYRPDSRASGYHIEILPFNMQFRKKEQ